MARLTLIERGPEAATRCFDACMPMTTPRDILTVAEMAAADRATIAAGTPGIALMQRAGAAVAEAVAERWTPRAVTLVLCGPGNNGGDGFIAARPSPSAAGRPPVAAGGELGQAEGRRGPGGRGVDGPGRSSVRRPACGGAELVIDALFGAGLSKPLAPAVVDVLQAAEASGAPIVAADLPSGLPGDTGLAAGLRAALRA